MSDTEKDLVIWPSAGVISDPSVFPSVDESVRLSTRRPEPAVPTSVAPLTDEDDDDGVRRIKGKVWRKKPFIADQASRMPESVRVGRPIYATYDLSKPAELTALNEIMARGWEEPRSVSIMSTERKFHDGAWFVLVVYAELLYQEL